MTLAVFGHRAREPFDDYSNAAKGSITPEERIKENINANQFHSLPIGLPKDQLATFL